jgi:hypothetical protein
MSLYYLLPTLPLYVQSLGGSNSEVGLIMGRLADAAGFEVVFLVAAALPMLGLAGLRRLRDREGGGAQAPK